MGVGNFLAELLGAKGNGCSKLIGIKRGFFQQGLLLVSICRRLPEPLPGHRSQEELRTVLEQVMSALREGADEGAERAENKTRVDEVFREATDALCRYIDDRRISLMPIRGSKDQTYYSSKRIAEDMGNAKRADENASQALKRVDLELRKKIEEIRKKSKVKITIQYFPDLGLPRWQPIHTNVSASKFDLPDQYNAPVYWAKNLFKVESGTSVEMVLHRLLQCTQYDNYLQSLTLAQHPEVYNRTPDNYHRVASLLPLDIVDTYVKKPLVLTMEIGSNRMIDILDIGKRNLPPDWTNLWVITESEQMVMVRFKDPDFTLRGYTIAEFYKIMQEYYNFDYSPYRAPGPNTLSPPMPDAHLINTSRPVSQGGSPSQDSQRHNLRPPPHYYEPQSLSSRPDPQSAPHSKLASLATQSTPRPGATPQPHSPLIAQTPSPRSVKPSVATSSSIDSAKSRQAKMQIPDSSAASHHSAGDMQSVGREKKGNATTKKSIWSRWFS